MQPFAVSVSGATILAKAICKRMLGGKPLTYTVPKPWYDSRHCISRPHCTRLAACTGVVPIHGVEQPTPFSCCMPHGPQPLACPSRPVFPALPPTHVTLHHSMGQREKVVPQLGVGVGTRLVG